MKGPPARHDDPREQLPAVEGVITDAGELTAGDRVVYPNQGVCRVTGIERKEIAGQRLELVRMEREEDGAAVLVPKAKVPSIGLRKVATGSQIEGVFHYLAAQYDDPELDWKVRHRDNADRLIAGGVLGVAEVVKGLHALSRIRPLPTKEREQYDNARHLLIHEVAVSLAVPAAFAEDYVDYALMPPAGVTFKLKPPPKPVMLPVRPRRRPVKPAGEDDLSLDDLGIDLGLGAELGEVPAVVDEAGAAGGVPAIPTADDIPQPEEAEEVIETPASEPEDEGAAEEEEEALAPVAAARERPKEKEREKAKPAAKKAPAKKAPAARVEPKARAEKSEKKKAAPKKPAAKGKKK